MTTLIATKWLKEKWFLVTFFIVFVIAAALFIAYTNKISDLVILGHDFRAYFTGGFMIKNGVSAQFYDLPTQFHWQQQVSLGYLLEQKYLTPFVYPSFVGLPFLPLSFFPLKTAYLIWGITNTVLLGVCVLMLTTLVEKKALFSESLKVSILLLTVTCIPVWNALFQGQFSFVLLLGFLGSFIAFQNNKPFQAGVWLALALAKPHLILLTILILVLKKQWKTLTGFGLGAIILLIISLILVGVEGLWGYIKLLNVIPTLGDALTVHPRNEPTLRGVLQVLWSTDSFDPVKIIYLVGVLLTIGLLVWVFKGRWQPRSERFRLLWSLLIIATIFTSLHTNFHELVLLLIPAVILLNYYLNRLSSKLTSSNMIVGSCVLIVLSTLVFLITLGIPPIMAPLLFVSMILLSLFSYKEYKNSRI